MFEWLSNFDTVLVTGPQRSGTRITAKMIAYDIGLEFVDEDEIGWDGFYRLAPIIESKRRVVIQCPALCRYAHMFNYDNLAVVLMRRKLEDIIASQKRIGWVWEWLELVRYDLSEGVIAKVKYQFWDQYQKERIRHPFEVKYEDLTGHPLWLEKDLRQKFLARQTANVDQLLKIDQHARPIPCSNIIYFDEQNQGIVIINKTNNCAKSLNVVGQFIWKLCDGAHTRQDILTALKTEFDDTKEVTLSSDLDRFISDLVINEYLRLEIQRELQ